MPINKVKGSKDGLQKYRVRVNYMDSSGKYRQIERTEYGLNEARETEHLLLAQIQQAPAKRMTVQTLFDEYIKIKRNETRASTADKAERNCRFHILPTLGDIRLDKLTLSVLQNWKTEMEEKTVSQKHGAEKLALQTKQNIYGEFRALLNYAVKMEYLSKNPLTKLGNFKDANTIKKPMDFYTPEEFSQFISASCKIAESSCRYRDWDYYVFFCIAFYAGLRKGEIHALKWTDIEDGYLSVTRSISQKSKEGDVETPPKNKSSIRTIQIPKPLMEILQEHKARYQEFPGFSEDFRITGGTRPLRDTSIDKANRRFAQAAGIKKIRIHDFRHSHASVLCNNGINIQEVARRLGHSRIEITWNIYSHLYPREEERATEILNKIRW